MNDEPQAVALPDEAMKPVELPEGVEPSRNYARAVELGHVLARSGYFTDARDPAQAAVKVMIGMDLGLSPTTALTGIHAFGEGGKTVFVIEGKLLAALIKARPGYDYRLVDRTTERVEVEFIRDGEPMKPTIVWTMEDAKRAGLDKKDNWKAYPREMLTWRALVEGVRIHFPEIMAGQPIYLDAEFGVEAGDLREAIEGPKTPPLTDDEAEALRDRARRAFEQLHELQPVVNRGRRMARPLLEARIRQAEHSHANLRNVAASIEDLRDSEKRIVDLEGELADRLDPGELRAIVERGERLTQQQQRIDLYESARDDFDRASGEAEPKGGDDAD